VRQLKSHLSQIYDIKSVLVHAVSEEMEELLAYLINKKRVESIYWVSERNVPYTVKDRRIISCTMEEALERVASVDTVIFDRDAKKDISQYITMKPRYVIGRLALDEEYFGLWETYRKAAESIYIVKDKGVTQEEAGPDGNVCDVVAWKRRETSIELSVILPVYNVEKYLPKCIETLTNWQAPYVEYIFVNDGSQDGSRDLILQYAQQDKRIRLIDKENGGCASARNRGIEEAKGRYIGFVDPDDFVDETMFRRLFERAMLGNYELTYCGYKEYYEESGQVEPVLNDCLSEPYLSGTYREDKVQLWVLRTRVAIWRCLYRKDILDKHKIRFHEDLRRFDDLPFRVEYAFVAKSAACIQEHLYYYRLGRKGQDVSCNDERLYVHFPIFDYLDEYVDRLGNPRLRDYLQIIKIHTHGFGLSMLEKKYRREYISRAKVQLDRNMGYWRTMALILIHTGKENIGWYTRMKLLG